VGEGGMVASTPFFDWSASDISGSASGEATVT
jgi:hypothetical protein